MEDRVRQAQENYGETTSFSWLFAAMFSTAKEWKGAFPRFLA